MGLGTFLLVQVGRAIIRIKPRELAKTLRRFKGSKEIKKPTDAQVDKSQTITGNLGNFNKVDRKIVAKADKARPSIVESLTGTGRGSGQKIIKEIPTGESRRNTVKNVAGVIASGTAGVALGKGSDKKNKKTTKSTTKTYAQMVKEDKEKGKAKVLARRQPLPMSPKNKNRKEDPPKDSKKKVKPVEKKKPIIKKKKVVTPPKKKKNGVTFEFKVGGKKDGR